MSLLTVRGSVEKASSTCVDQDQKPVPDTGRDPRHLKFGTREPIAKTSPKSKHLETNHNPMHPKYGGGLVQSGIDIELV